MRETYNTQDTYIRLLCLWIIINIFLTKTRHNLTLKSTIQELLKKEADILGVILMWNGKEIKIKATNEY